MTKSMAFIKYEKATGRQELYFCDPKADFYVLYQTKLYNLRKQFLSPSYYFSRKIQKNHRIHVLEGNFKVSTFQKVISCFYGLKCMYDRSRQCSQIMEVVQFIQCKDLQQLLRKQIAQNIAQYDIFPLLNLSKKHNDKQLENICHQELIRQNFQQFNFNRFELLQCHQEVFKSLIRLHQKLKRKGSITGISFQALRKIIIEYNTANNTSVDLLTVLTPPSSLIIMEDPEGEKQSPMPQKCKKLKRHQTIGLNYSYDFECYELPISNDSSYEMDEEDRFSCSCYLQRESSIANFSSKRKQKAFKQMIQEETEFHDSIYNQEGTIMGTTFNLVAHKGKGESEFGRSTQDNDKLSCLFKKKINFYTQSANLVHLSDSLTLQTQKQSDIRLVSSHQIQKSSSTTK